MSIKQASNPLPDRLALLDVKLKAVLAELRQLKEERTELLDERRQLRQTIDRQREDIRTYQQQMKDSAIASTLADVDGQTVLALRMKIDQYVAEIDSCLAHLAE
jgi:flagellar motility protein MotE (MotC chaperone)